MVHSNLLCIEQERAGVDTLTKSIIIFIVQQNHEINCLAFLNHSTFKHDDNNLDDHNLTPAAALRKVGTVGTSALGPRTEHVSSGEPAV